MEFCLCPLPAQNLHRQKVNSKSSIQDLRISDSGLANSYSRFKAHSKWPLLQKPFLRPFCVLLCFVFPFQSLTLLLAQIRPLQAEVSVCGSGSLFRMGFWKDHLSTIKHHCAHGSAQRHHVRAHGCTSDRLSVWPWPCACAGPQEGQPGELPPDHPRHRHLHQRQAAWAKQGPWRPLTWLGAHPSPDSQ